MGKGFCLDEANRLFIPLHITATVFSGNRGSSSIRDAAVGRMLGDVQRAKPVNQKQTFVGMRVGFLQHD